MLHTFDGPCYTKIEKYMKKVIATTFFHVFLIFRVARYIEIMQHEYSLDDELNFSFDDCSCSKFK